MIDLKKVQSELSSEKIIKLVYSLGVKRHTEKNDCIIFPTCCHNHDADDCSDKLYYYKKNHRFVCYTDCGDSFNIFELFKRRYELLGIEYNFYKDIVLKIADGQSFKDTFNDFGQKYISHFDRYEDRFENVKIEEINPNLLNIYVFNPTPEWLSDGISEQSMRDYNILYSIPHNKIIIPHYNANGGLVGIRGRALNDEDLVFGKYMPVTIEGKIYAHPLGYNLYGLNRVKENIRRTGMAIVAESEKSALQFQTMFGQESNFCVASCGSSLHPYQVELLKECGAKKILVAYDKEGDDWKGVDKYFLKLEKMCKQYKSYAEMGFIFDTKNLLNLKDSPTDRGKETFLKLYKEAHWIK